jgi:alkylation response protein AidB-like acyl-CoA dehydrogenase
MIDRGAVLVPTSQVTVLDDWDTIGLRGSGSNSIVAKDVFVPSERVALFSRFLKEEYASTHLRREPLYRMPLLPLLATNLLFPILGMAKAALELFVELVPRRRISYTHYEKQDEATITHLKIAEVTEKIDTAELILRRSVHDVQVIAVSNMQMTREHRARIWRDAGTANQMLWEAVDLLAGMSGSSFARVGDPMNRLWRDVRVAGLHGGIRTSTSLEIFGRVFFGKDPNTDLL